MSTRLICVRGRYTAVFLSVPLEPFPAANISSPQRSKSSKCDIRIPVAPDLFVISTPCHSVGFSSLLTWALRLRTLPNHTRCWSRCSKFELIISDNPRLTTTSNTAASCGGTRPEVKFQFRADRPSLTPELRSVADMIGRGWDVQQRPGYAREMAFAASETAAMEGDIGKQQLG